MKLDLGKEGTKNGEIRAEKLAQELVNAGIKIPVFTDKVGTVYVEINKGQKKQVEDVVKAHDASEPMEEPITELEMLTECILELSEVIYQ